MWRSSNNFGDSVHLREGRARFRRSCLGIAGSARGAAWESSNNFADFEQRHRRRARFRRSCLKIAGFGLAFAKERGARYNDKSLFSRLEAGMQIETVETSSFEMDYFRFGRGNDTLVILPGLSVQSVMNVADAIATAYRLLADDFTIYIFDRRKSFSAPYTVRMMAHDTCEALRALELDRINLFGTSLGGMTALQIAERLGARPDFQLHMYDGYGHAAYDTAPDYKERLLRFLIA